GIKPTDKPDVRRAALGFEKRDDTCYGWDAFDGCIPWEITQGPSIWAVHYTVTGIVSLDQECSFGPGGVLSGAATCTADGRLDPEVWGRGDGPRTHTFPKSDVDLFWIRNTVGVTEAGGVVAATSVSASGTGTRGVLQGQSVVAGSVEQSVGGGGIVAMPTGLVAMGVGAGGVLMAALAL
ncbi:hypothetical protein EK21DRAFT_93951, partial [Setomelanomma holmii]